ncbi:hypothetical protein [Desmospora activa]|uniref:hypothetical protein n=1 Tax=Desmospora activa TaxID=500615 RepID=UPI0011B299B0|nr:hypothetical protein [Desmospora activa]
MKKAEKGKWLGGHAVYAYPQACSVAKPAPVSCKHSSFTWLRGCPVLELDGIRHSDSKNPSLFEITVINKLDLLSLIVPKIRLFFIGKKGTKTSPEALSTVGIKIAILERQRFLGGEADGCTFGRGSFIGIASGG